MLPRLLADACISMPVVTFLRDRGVDVASLYERGLTHLDDRAILRLASAERRFVLTHDSDFATIALVDGEQLHGILFVRPGDRPPAQVIAALLPLLDLACDWSPPLIAVFRDGRLRLRRPDAE